MSGPTRIATSASVSADLDVDGRTIHLSYSPTVLPKSDDPITLPKGVVLPLRAESMTIEWLGPGLPGSLQDDYTDAAFAALKAKRKEIYEAERKAIAQVGQRALLDQELPSKASRLDELPRELQEAFRAAVAQDFKEMGFKRKDDALAALETGRLSGFAFGAMIHVSNPGSIVQSEFGLRTVRF